MKSPTALSDLAFVSVVVFLFCFVFTAQISPLSNSSGSLPTFNQEITQELTQGKQVILLRFSAQIFQQPNKTGDAKHYFEEGKVCNDF